MSENGQIKCEKCGSTDISQNPKTGKLRCNYCRYEFEPEKSEEIVTDAGKLEGEHVNKGAEDIKRRCGKNSFDIISDRFNYFVDSVF